MSLLPPWHGNTVLPEMDGLIKKVAEEDRGPWMHTSLGGRFYPADPRPEEIFISDIANGHALDCRYGGQGRVDRFYSVAEHCCHLYDWSRRVEWPWGASLALLLHDSPEAYLRDLPMAVKSAVGRAYKNLEDKLAAMIFEKYGVSQFYYDWAREIKAADNAIAAPVERHHIMRHIVPWPQDHFQALPGVEIGCWNPRVAKLSFLSRYVQAAIELGLPFEEYEI